MKQASKAGQQYVNTASHCIILDIPSCNWQLMTIAASATGEHVINANVTRMMLIRSPAGQTRHCGLLRVMRNNVIPRSPLRLGRDTTRKLVAPSAAEAWEGWLLAGGASVLMLNSVLHSTIASQGQASHEHSESKTASASWVDMAPRALMWVPCANWAVWLLRTTGQQQSTSICCATALFYAIPQLRYDSQRSTGTCKVAGIHVCFEI